MTLQGSIHTLILLFCIACLDAQDMRKDVTSAEETPNVIPPEDLEFRRPVDFMHVYREGFGDTEYKQPVHFLEFDMTKPKDSEHGKKLLEKAHKNNIQWIPKQKSMVFNSPRDEYIYYKKLFDSGKNKTDLRDRRYMHDFSRILERNLAFPVMDSGRQSENKENLSKVSNEPKKDVRDYFEENSFYFKPETRMMNWTTCDEFAKRALFHPDDIVNTNWIPFYIWSKRRFSSATIHKFSYPTKKRVNYYKTSFGPYLKGIDWSKPKLLLKEKREMLLIAADGKGLFYEIPDQLPPTPEEGDIKLPTLTLRIKIQNPYVALMSCDEFYATIMAEYGTEPVERDEKISEATKLGFRGIGLPAYRDIEAERARAKMIAKMKEEMENRKIIHIKKLTGDVDEKVRHAR